jgi:hypothetical protein
MDSRDQLDALDRARSRDRVIGLLVITLVFAACLGFTYWAQRESMPELAEPPAPPTHEGIVGWPRSVDPLRQLERARGLTRRPMLRRVVIELVAANGMIDVAGADAHARYSFQSPPGEGAQPEREPGTVRHRHFCGKQEVVLNHSGIGAGVDQTGERCPPSLGDALPDPQCTLADVFKRAIELGADATRPAHVEYYRAHVGPSWRFEQHGRHPLWIYGDCSRALNSAEAAEGKGL